MFEKKVEYPIRAVEDPLVLVGDQDKQYSIQASLVSPEVFRLKSFWLFDPFPDELIIEEKRIIIKQKQLPFFITTVSIPVDRVIVFRVTSALFFSSIYIKGMKDMTEVEEYTISWLNQKEARMAKEILDGLRLKHYESVLIPYENPRNKIQALQVLGNIY